MEGFIYDVLYVLGTFVFFALVRAYIAACAKLGECDARSEEA